MNERGQCCTFLYVLIVQLTWLHPTPLGLKLPVYACSWLYLGQIVTYIFLYLQDSCDINACTNENQTALHLAVFQGHLAIVERLVGYGAQLNIQDSNGSTPLHLALTSYSTERITADTPQMKKVSYSLHMYQMFPV